MLLSQAMPSIGDVTLWEKYGLTGLILFALFVSLFALSGAFVWFGKRVLTSNDGAVVKAQEFLDGVMEQHRAERAEWREDSIRQAEVHAAAIKDMHQRTIEACERNTEACNNLAAEMRMSTRRAKA